MLRRHASLEPELIDMMLHCVSLLPARLSVGRLVPAVAMLGLVFWSGPARAEAQTLTLRPRWTAGQTAVYEFWSQRRQRVEVAFMGDKRSGESMLTTEGQTRWVVEKVADDGSATCTMTLLWLTATMQTEAGRQVVDSRKASSDIEPLHKLLKAMTGTDLTVKVGADGRVDSVDGVEAVKRKIGKDFEQLVPDPLEFAESASDMATLPGAPETAEVGDTYKADFRWKHEMGHTDQDWTYTLASVEEIEGVPVATVTGAGRLKLDVDRSQLPDDGPPVDVRMTQGAATAQVFFDLERGEPVGRNSTRDESVLVTITLPGGRGRMVRTIETTVQEQLLRVEEAGGSDGR